MYPTSGGRNPPNTDRIQRNQAKDSKTLTGSKKTKKNKIQRRMAQPCPTPRVPAHFASNFVFCFLGSCQHFGILGLVSLEPVSFLLAFAWFALIPSEFPALPQPLILHTHTRQRDMYTSKTFPYTSKTLPPVSMYAHLFFSVAKHFFPRAFEGLQLHWTPH